MITRTNRQRAVRLPRIFGTSVRLVVVGRDNRARPECMRQVGGRAFVSKADYALLIIRRDETT